MNNILVEELKENLHYDPETGRFIWVKAIGRKIRVGDIAGYFHKESGYIRICIGGKIYRAHRLAWVYMMGEMPKEFIDHINNDRTDNRFCNLREATKTQNNQNIIKVKGNNTTGFLGVSFSKKEDRYIAQISIGNKSKFIGYFATPEEAHQAYLDKKRQMHEFCTI